MSQSTRVFAFVYLITVLVVAALARPQSTMDNSQVRHQRIFMLISRGWILVLLLR